MGLSLMSKIWGRAHLCHQVASVYYIKIRRPYTACSSTTGMLYHFGMFSKVLLEKDIHITPPTEIVSYMFVTRNIGVPHGNISRGRLLIFQSEHSVSGHVSHQRKLGRVILELNPGKTPTKLAFFCPMVIDS